MKTIKQNLFLLFDSFDTRKISSWELYDLMFFRTSKKTLPHTLTKYAAEYADISGGSFKCTDRTHSIYSFVKGHSIAGYISGGVE